MWLTVAFLYLRGVLLELSLFRGATVLSEPSIEVSRNPKLPIRYEQLELPFANSMDAKFFPPGCGAAAKIGLTVPNSI